MKQYVYHGDFPTGIPQSFTTAYRAFWGNQCDLRQQCTGENEFSGIESRMDAFNNGIIVYDRFLGMFTINHNTYKLNKLTWEKQIIIHNYINKLNKHK